MATTESNSRSKSEILGTLGAHDSGDTVIFTSGRRPVTVRCWTDSYEIQGIRREYNGAKIAANVIAAMVRG